MSPGKVNVFVFTGKMPSVLKYFILVTNKLELAALEAEQRT